MNVEKAITFVRSRGDAVEQARLAAILWDASPSEEALRELTGLQRPDGGFAYWVKGVSNLCDTAFILQWLDDLEVFRGPIVDPACRFILDRQHDDGSWDEVEAVRDHRHPAWMTPGRIETRVWLTAFCAHALIRFGYAEAPETRCPTDFLLDHRDDAGRLKGYLRATWIALPTLALHPGTHSEPFRKAVEVVEANYSPDWEGSYLAWLARCAHDGGLPAAHPLVVRCLTDLVCGQRPDGSWEAEEGEEHTVSATIAALGALARYGVL